MDPSHPAPIPPDSPTGSAPPGPSSTAPTFRYVGGDPALDFVNTVAWTSTGLTSEKLIDYDALLRWGEGADVVASGDADALRHRARTDPSGATAALERARAMRDTVHAIFLATAHGERPPGAALDAFNTALSDAEAHGAITVAEPDGRLVREWRGLHERMDGVLWPVLRAAAALLTSPEMARVRACAGEDCGWMYVDRSRNGMRRWCEMETCGSRAKARRYYARRRGRDA